MKTSSLTREERAIVDRIILSCVVSLYKVISISPTPKEYSRKVILKRTRYKSKKNLAATRLLFDARNSPSTQLLTPKELNRQLATELQRVVPVDDTDMTVRTQNSIESQRYLHPRYLSEVLETLRERGVYLRIEGEKAIKNQKGESRPGKRRHANTTNYFGRGGGRPFAHKITPTVERLKEIMSKAGVKSLLYNQLKKSKLLFVFEKFMIEAYFHALREDEQLAEKLLLSTKSNPVEDSHITAFRNLLVELSEDMLPRIAAKDAKISVRRRKDDDIYSLLGLFNL